MSKRKPTFVNYRIAARYLGLSLERMKQIMFVPGNGNKQQPHHKITGFRDGTDWVVKRTEVYRLQHMSIRETRPTCAPRALDNRAQAIAIESLMYWANLSDANHNEQPERNLTQPAKWADQGSVYGYLAKALREIVLHDTGVDIRGNDELALLYQNNFPNGCEALYFATETKYHREMKQLHAKRSYGLE